LERRGNWVEIPNCPRNCKSHIKFLQKTTAKAGRCRKAKVRRPARILIINKMIAFGGKANRL